MSVRRRKAASDAFCACDQRISAFDRKIGATFFPLVAIIFVSDFRTGVRGPKRRRGKHFLRNFRSRRRETLRERERKKKAPTNVFVATSMWGQMSMKHTNSVLKKKTPLDKLATRIKADAREIIFKADGVTF